MTRRTLARIARYGVLLVFLVIAGYPLFWMFCTSLRGEFAVRTRMWALPESFSVANYREVLAHSNLARYLLNSTMVVSAAVVLTLIAAALAAFAFARLRFRARAALFALLLLGMMIPVHILLVPLKKMTAAMGLGDTLWSLGLVYVAFSLPVSVFILRGFFARVPRELEEAARIDGCGDFGVFRHVMLPGALPALAVVTIFNTITLWNEFVFALTLLVTPEHRTLPVGVYEFFTEYGLSITQVCTALCVAALPVLVVYFLAQRYIIRGLTAGAVKG